MIVLSACSDDFTIGKVADRNVARGQIGSYVVYYGMDARTKLCYSYSNESTYLYSMTIVPCTDEVRKAIEQDRRQ